MFRFETLCPKFRNWSMLATARSIGLKPSRRLCTLSALIAHAPVCTRFDSKQPVAMPGSADRMIASTRKLERQDCSPCRVRRIAVFRIETSLRAPMANHSYPGNADRPSTALFRIETVSCLANVCTAVSNRNKSPTSTVASLRFEPKLDVCALDTAGCFESKHVRRTAG